MQIYFQKIGFTEQIISQHKRRIIKKPKCCLVDTFKITLAFYILLRTLDYKDLQFNINIIYIHMYSLFWQRKTHFILRPKKLPLGNKYSDSHKHISNKMVIWLINRKKTITPHLLSAGIQIFTDLCRFGEYWCTDEILACLGFLEAILMVLRSAVLTVCFLGIMALPMGTDGNQIVHSHWQNEWPQE